MKKGINQWAFAPGTTTSEAMRKAKDAGFDAIELCFEEEGDTSFDATAEDLAEVAAAARSVGIEIASVATGVFWKYSLTSDEENTREKAKEMVRTMLRIAQHLGTDAILVIPGAVLVPWLPDSEVVPYATAHERARDAIGDLAGEAEKAKVAIAVENVWNGMFLSPVELRDFIDSIGSDYVGAYFDVGNCIGTGCPEDWIRILGGRIKRVHMKDYRRSAAGLGGFVGLLEGDANWPMVMAALRDAGYTGSLTVETSPYAYAPDAVLYHTSRSLDAIMAMG
jgi:L-ribulose-5-phosphate 3-epimerase